MGKKKELTQEDMLRRWCYTKDRCFVTRPEAEEYAKQLREEGYITEIAEGKRPRKGIYVWKK